MGLNLYGGTFLAVEHLSQLTAGVFHSSHSGSCCGVLMAKENSGLLKLKQGVAIMSSRTFGERWAEALLKARYGETYGLEQSKNQAYDLVERGGLRAESKFSRLFVPISKVKDDLKLPLAQGSSKSFASLNGTWTANFQKLHPSEFDVLYYGLVLNEGILIHRAKVEELHLSNQHRNTTTIKQFHIDQDSLAAHQKHRIELLSWDTLLSIVDG